MAPSHVNLPFFGGGRYRVSAAALAVSAAICALAAAVAVAQGRPADWPWRAGDQVADCVVTTCTNHPEFYRCTLRCPRGDAGVELVGADPRRPSPEWSSARYRLQPAPGASPPEGLLFALRERLFAWDRAPRDRPGQLGVQRADSADAWRFEELLLLLAVALAVCGAMALRCATPTALALARASAAPVAGLAAAVAAWALLRSTVVPLAWLTSLHEGTTSANVALLHGHTPHAGPLLAALVHLCAAGDAVSARDVVATNSCAIAALAVAALALCASARQWTWVAGAATVAAAPIAPWLAWSESEAATATLFAAAALPGLVVLGRSGPVRDRRAGWAAAHLALCTALCALCRTELAGFGLAALAWHASRFVWGDAALTACARRLGAVGRRHPVVVAVALAGAAASAWPVNELVQPGARWTWFAAGIHPTNPTILAAPALALSLLPIAACALVGLGIVRLWRDHLLGWGWALAASVVLFRVWFAASHRVYFEMVRYGLGLAPLVVGLACLGAVEWTDRLRRWGPRWPMVVAWLAMAAALAVPTSPWPAMLVWPIREGALADAPLLDRDQQAEVRALAEVGDLFPGCAWLTAIHPAQERKDAGTQSMWLAFGPPVRSPRALPPGHDAASALRSVAPTAPCGMLYRGLDCHLVQGPDCAALERGLAVLWSSRRPARTYADPIEYGELRRTIEFAVLRLW